MVTLCVQIVNLSFLNLGIWMTLFQKLLKTSITALHSNKDQFWKNIKSIDSCVLNYDISLFIIHIGILQNDPSKQTAATADPPPISHEVFYLWHLAIFGWVMVPLSFVKNLHFDCSDLGAILDILNYLLWAPLPSSVIN